MLDRLDAERVGDVRLPRACTAVQHAIIWAIDELGAAEWANFCFVNLAGGEVDSARSLAAGIPDRLWPLDDVIARIDAMAPAPKARRPFRTRDYPIQTLSSSRDKPCSHGAVACVLCNVKRAIVTSFNQFPCLGSMLWRARASTLHLSRGDMNRANGRIDH